MKLLRYGALTLAVLLLAGAGSLIYFSLSMRGEIVDFEKQLLARVSPAPKTVRADWAGLPAPVQRYFRFTFPENVPRASDIAWVEVEMAGEFRRPLTEGFAPTTARQIVNTGAPDMVFSADTPIFGPLWAIAYDVYVGGEMEMRAKVLSAMTVMEQRSTPELNRTSLRRWLLESPLYPMALLPGGPVTWQAVGENKARAVVRAYGEEASLVATFREDGSLERFDAEGDGDLTTPYHGSGEHVMRSDYQIVEGQRIPMRFEIARAAGGKLYPFWRGRITSIRFGSR